MEPNLQDDGYEVIRGAVPPAMCRAVVDALAAELGIEADDDRTSAAVSTEIDQAPMWGHESQWAIRQLPRLHRRWAEISGTPALWVSVESVRFTRPWRPGLPDAQRIHWDVDPLDPGQQWYSGVLALTATPPGGFRCVPGLFRDRAAWADTVARHGEGPGLSWCPDASGYDIVDVPCAVGDLIIMDSHLPHGTRRNEGTTPRLAFYVQYFPAGDDAAASERVADHRAGRATVFTRWKPGHDRLEAGPPVELGPLGRRLLGTDPWPSRLTPDGWGRRG